MKKTSGIIEQNRRLAERWRAELNAQACSQRSSFVGQIASHEFEFNKIIPENFQLYSRLSLVLVLDWLSSNWIWIPEKKLSIISVQPAFTKTYELICKSAGFQLLQLAVNHLFVLLAGRKWWNLLFEISTLLHQNWLLLLNKTVSKLGMIN